MTVSKDITVKQGTTHVEAFIIEVLTNPYLDFNATTNPYIPLDLTLATIRMMVRSTFDATQILLNATDANGKFVKTGINTFELRLIPSDTSSVRYSGEEADYVYDIEIELAPNNVIRPVGGSFIIGREVTR